MMVLGESIAAQFDGWVSPERLHVVPNGADFPGAGDRGQQSGVLRVLYVGNMQEGKGILDIVQAAAILKARNVSFRLDAVGAWRDDRVRQKCLRTCSAKGLPVDFHPPASGQDKFEYFKEADVFVFTPRQREGHPWVILEAMAAGLPVISTDQGAIAETVTDGESGYIVPPGDPEAIAGKVALLAREPERRLRMGGASRKRYEDHYTEEAMVRGFTRVFRAALGETGKASP
jgi:glycosyltransferase involved in cell wall biosynthesis